MSELIGSSPPKGRQSSTDEETDEFISKGRPFGYGYQEIPNPNLVRSGSIWSRTVTKLGRFQLAILVVGGIGLLTGIGVLRYLWPWPSRGDSDKHWEAVVFSGWLLRVITLSCIVIRVSMAMQATVFSMVMASIALQRSKVLVQDVASVSIFRFTNSGPHYMILPLLRTSKEWKSYLAVVVTVLISMTTIASQFTSTILFMDIGTKNLKTRGKDFNVSYGADSAQLNEFYVGTTASKWDGRPSVFQAFAEDASPNIKLEGHPNGGGLFATGHSLRALFPLTKQQRLLLAQYDGPAAVIDSRVACVSPYIMELTVKKSNDEEQEMDIHGVASADTLLDYSDKLAHFGFFAEGNRSSNFFDDFTFNCRWPNEMTPLSKPFPEWKVSLCELPEDNFIETYDDDLSLGFVVFNMSGIPDLWLNTTVNETEIGFGNQSDGEWTKLSYPAPNGGSSFLNLSISFCFTSFTAKNAVVSAYADWNLTEPVLSKNTDAPRYNTTLIRRHLGVGNDETIDLDYTTRGILELTYVDHESMANLSDTEVYIRESLIDQSLGPPFDLPNPTARMCIWCMPNVRVHEGFIAIFNDVLVTTGHPALAIQAFLTARALQIYDERSPDFQFSQIASVSLLQPFQVPTSMGGFYAVCAVITFHLMLMLYVVFLFFKIDEQTSLGQAWQTIGQIHGQEMQEILAVAKTSTDREVKKWLVEKEENATVVGLRGGSVVRTSPKADLHSGSESIYGGRPQSILSFRSTRVGIRPP